MTYVAESPETSILGMNPNWILNISARENSVPAQEYFSSTL